MTYSLDFLPSARKEWDKPGSSIRQQLIKKLRERLDRPRIPSAALHATPDHYKFKLGQAGYRLVYRVDDATIVVLVIAVGKREGGQVYEIAKRR